MSGASRPQRDEYLGAEPALALHNYLVTPDFQLQPKSTWEHINPVLQPEYEQMLQDEVNRVKGRPGVLEQLNNSNFGKEWLHNRELLREKEIEAAAQEGRIAQKAQKSRSPASLQELMTGARKRQLNQSPWFGRILPGSEVEQPSYENVDDYEDRSDWTPEDWKMWKQQRQVMERNRFDQ